MIDPGHADIGRKVIYHDRGRGTLRRGIVKDFNAVFVYVRYDGDLDVKATVRHDLVWTDEPEPD